MNMKKPYIICHMMESIDGRNDCGIAALNKNEKHDWY